MGKRFTDTEKWKKPFVKGLQDPYKLLWFYILDDCDHAGIWQVDFDIVSLRVSKNIDPLKAVVFLEHKIQIFDNGEKWFIKDFIDFQYGELNPANRVHNSIIQILNKHKIKGLTSTLQGAMDKDKDKGKDKEGGVGETKIDVRTKDFKNVTDYKNCQMYEYSELSEELKKMYPETIWTTWKAFNQHIDENCKFIRLIDEQIKIHEYVKIKNEYIDKKIISVERLLSLLDDFNNYKPGRDRYNSVYAAFNGWLKREIK